MGRGRARFQWPLVPIPKGYERIVTDEQVGEFAVKFTRRGAQALCDSTNGPAVGVMRPVEYRPVRRGPLRWAVVAFQAKLVSTGRETLP